MQPDGEHPAAHYDLGFLQKNTQAIEYSTWFRVKDSSAHSAQSGWVAAAHVIHPIEMAAVLKLKRSEPLRTQPALDQVSSLRAKVGSAVLALEVQKFWVRVRLLGGDFSSKDFFLPRSSLEVSPTNSVERAIVQSPTRLYLAPNRLPLIKEPLRELIPGSLLQVLSRQKDWIEVNQPSSGFSGFVPTRDILPLTRLSLSKTETAVAPRALPLALHKDHQSGSDPIHRVDKMIPLTIVDTRSARWGRLKTKDHGIVFWQMDAYERFSSKPSEAINKLTSEELLKRKVFDMAQSPALKNLRLASANGVYRSLDGKHWSLVPSLKKKNYPIEFSPSGRLYVGPYVSDDHGHSFKEWVRWDLVTSALQRKVRTAPESQLFGSFGDRSLRLDQIRVLDHDGNRVRIILRKETSDEKNTRVLALVLETEDQGKSWTAVSSAPIKQTQH